MKISASLYSSKEKDFTTLVKELDAYKTDYFHIDSIENPAVFEDIKKVRKVSNTPIDLHLITSDPEKYYDLIAENNIELLTIQHENLTSDLIIPDKIKSEIGIAIVSETSIDVFEKYQDQASFILFMATTPGKSGGAFNKENFKKIREFRAKYPNKKIYVDGGINEELSFILRNMGVYSVVIGSYLFKTTYIGSAMLELKSDNIKSHFLVQDFMLGIDEIPVMLESEFDFKEMLVSIDKFNMGFTNITGDDGELKGIITNADLRKYLIEHIDDLQNADVHEMINSKPACVNENDTVSDVLEYIKNLAFPVLFLPVIDDQKRIVGTLKFNNLIKGE